MRALALAAAVLFVCACDPEESASPPALENGSFTLELAERAIHYEVHGRGPVLMTVPNSWGLTLDGLRAMYRPLEEHLTLVYFDTRGMGTSGPVREENDLGPGAVREDFRSLQKHLGLDPVSAIGWSNGASNLILLAAEAPESISAAIFLHGIASFAETEERVLADDYPLLMRAFADFGREMAESEYTVEERNARVKEFDTEVWFPYMCADSESGKRMLPALFRDAEFSWAHAQYTQMEWATLDLREQLPRIRARSLVIAGRHDMLPPEKAKEIVDGVDGAEFVVFEESGHFAPVEERERFVRTVVDFLKPPGGPSGGDRASER